MNVSEFELIDKIRSLQSSIPDGIFGIGDDAAVIPLPDGQSVVITTDALVENVHFRRDWASAYQIGCKSAAVNLSDVASMGADPFAMLLSVSLPPDTDSRWVDDFISGIGAYGVPLIGGDTTSSESGIFINITALGKMPSNSVRYRSGAKDEDNLYVTGTLGDSGAGLYILENSITGYDSLVEAHLCPRPCIQEGTVLAKTDGVNAMMDISDGLAGDVMHILKESKLSAKIDCSSLPLSDQLLAFCSAYSLDPLKFALESGEDYQLLFAADKKICLPLQAKKIGILLQNGRCEVEFENSGNNLQFHGFTHF